MSVSRRWKKKYAELTLVASLHDIGKKELMKKYC
jgi:hypothetical protein